MTYEGAMLLSLEALQYAQMIEVDRAWWMDPTTKNELFRLCKEQLRAIKAERKAIGRKLAQARKAKRRAKR